MDDMTTQPDNQPVSQFEKRIKGNPFTHYMELKYLRSLKLVTKGITHNYNNIFSGMLGVLQESGKGPEKTGDVLTSLVTRAIEETEVLFGLARYGGEQENTQSLQGIVENTVKTLRTISPKYVIDLQIHESMLQVKGRYSELALMLFYLGENSIEAMPDGGNVLFEVSHHSHMGNGSWVTVAVSDDGPGVDSRMIQEMFSPFTSTKDLKSHYGLGLYFARKTAEIHGGELVYSSDYKEKEAFVVKLPAIIPNSPEQIKPVEAENSKSSVSDKEDAKHVFFVIDDDPILLEYLVEGLQRRGHMVFSASSCDETFEGFEHVRNIVTVLLVDVGLAECNGAECVARLREKYTLPGVIFMSGEKENGVTDMISNAVFLEKPFTIRQLEGLAADVTKR